MEKGKGACLNSEVKERLSENRTFDLGPEEEQKKAFQAEGKHVPKSLDRRECKKTSADGAA